MAKSSRVKSDPGPYVVTNNSNKQKVKESMKSLNFYWSSLDHRISSIDRLQKSKARNFAMWIDFNSKSKQYVIYFNPNITLGFQSLIRTKRKQKQFQ